jgi:hypothetical protein
LIITKEFHLTDGDIARFIEGNCSDDEGSRIAEHLRTCRRCRDTYQDSAVYGWLFESGSPAFASTEETVEAGLQATTGTPGDVTARGEGERISFEGARIPRGEKRRVSPRRRPALGVAAACAVVIAAVVVLFRSTGRDGDHIVSPSDLAPVRAAVEIASQCGPYVLPGGERPAGEAGSVRRSGSVPMNDELESSLEKLLSAYRTGKASNDEAYWLVAGAYATGQIDIARDIAAGAAERYPGDSRIAVVEALIAYTDGDHGRAERLFRAILDTTPDAAAASINLAILLAEQGNVGEARAILENVKGRHAGTPLASRAESILSEMEGR